VWGFLATPSGGLAAGGILLLLALLCAYSNILLSGQSLVASANRHPFDYRFDHLRPGRAQGPAFLNWHDLGATWWQWEPAGAFFRRSIAEGEFPLWDPYTAGGVDTHVAVTQGQYFPPYLLLLLAGNTPLERDLYYLALLLFSGGCCYLLLWRNGLHVVSAATMAVAFMLSGALTQNVNSIIGQSTAMLPLMVLATDWLLEKPSYRRVSGAALAYGFACLSSFLPIVISGFLLCAIYAAATELAGAKRGLAPWRASFKPLSRFAAAVFLALGVAAFLLLPFELASKRDAYFQAWYAGNGTGLMHYAFPMLFSLVSPRLFYDILQTLDPRDILFPMPTYPVSLFYAGLAPLMLAALSRRGEQPAERKLFYGMLAGAVILLGKLFGVPPFQWIGYLPVFKYLHFIPYFCGALTFAIAGLAGLGVESVVRGRLRWSSTAGVTVAVVLFFAFYFRYAQNVAVNPRGDPQLLMQALSRHEIELARLALLALGLFAVLALALIDRSRSREASVCLLLLAGLDLFPLARRTRFERSDVWRDVPRYAAFLEADRSLFRVHSTQDLTLTPNTNQGLEIAGISSRSVLHPSRYVGLLSRYFPMQGQQFPIAAALLPNQRGILNLLNVKYLVTFQPTPEETASLTAAGLDLREQDGLFQIFENRACWPRAYLTSRYRVASNAPAALEALAALRSPDEVVLEQPPGFPSADTAQPLPRVTGYHPNTVTIETDSGTPAVLVLLDNFAPGWSVRVDGKPARILHADYAFRGVAVPAGHARVDFRYSPPGFAAGWAITGTTLAGIALLGGLSLRPKRASSM